MSIEKAKMIRGWMSSLELTWLAERASLSSVVVEIGSMWGRSTRALGDSCPGRVYAVDTWAGVSEAEQELDKQVTWDDEKASVIYEKLGGDHVYHQFRMNVLDLISRGTVLPVRMDSVAAARCVPDGVDLVFIDGSHDEASVRADIAAWMHKIRPGGIISGHDYNGLPWHQVKKVVDETFDHVSVCDNIWWREV